MGALINAIIAFVLMIAASVGSTAQRLNTQPEYPVPSVDRIQIENIGLDLPVVHRAWDSVAARQAIDACAGAVVVWDTQTNTPDGGVMVFAAHRTSCGSAGFGGVENLVNGDVVRIDGHPLTVVGQRYGRYYADLWSSLIQYLDSSVVAVLQTSLPDSRVVWQLLAV